MIHPFLFSAISEAACVYLRALRHPSRIPYFARRSGSRRFSYQEACAPLLHPKTCSMRKARIEKHQKGCETHATADGVQLPPTAQELVCEFGILVQRGSQQLIVGWQDDNESEGNDRSEQEATDQPTG